MPAFACVFSAEQVFRNHTAYLSTNPAQRAEIAAQTTKHARAEAELLLSLTPVEAVARIEQTRAVEATRRAEQERTSRYGYGPELRSTPRRDPARGL